MKTSTLPKEYIIEKLIDLGCGRWTKLGHDRIYLPEELIHDLLDIKVYYYNTGNVSSFYRNGEKESNGFGRRVLAQLNTKFYYDIPTGKYKSRNASAYTSEIFSELDRRLHEQYEKEHEITAPAL